MSIQLIEDRLDVHFFLHIYNNIHAYIQVI